MKFMNSCKSQLTKFNKSIINYFHRVFRAIFPLLRVVVGVCNFIFTLAGVLMLLTTVIMYCVPSYHVFVDALKYICNVKMVFGSFVALGIISTVVGFCGIHFLRKREYDKLGLQAASFLVLLIVLSAISFTFYVEWHANAHFGMSYATQSYDPEQNDHLYLGSIQHFMKCCGARGPEDYEIGNEYFMKSTVPISCCDSVRFPNWCLEKTIQLHKEFQHVDHGNTTKVRDPSKLSIPRSRAFNTGCQTQLNEIIFLIVTIAAMLQGSLCLATLIMTAVTCIVYHACIKPTEEDNDEGEENHGDDIGVIRGVSRDHTSMELLSHCTADEPAVPNQQGDSVGI